MQLLKATSSNNTDLSAALTSKYASLKKALDSSPKASDPKPQSSSPAAIIRLSNSALSRPQAIITGNNTLSLDMSLSPSARMGLGEDRLASITADAANQLNVTGSDFTNAHTNKIIVSVVLTKGETYSPTANYGHVRSGGIPKLQLSVKDPLNNVIFKSTTNSGQFIAKTTGTYSFTWELTNNTSVFTGFTASLSSKSLIPKKSGDANIDALLMGGTNQWWHTPGNGTTVSTSASDLIKQGLYSLASGSSSTTLNYSFLSAAPSDASVQDATGFTSLSDGMKSTVLAAFDYIASITNLSFTEVTGNADANIYFGANTQTNSDGYAYMPNTKTAANQQKTYVYLSDGIEARDDAAIGTYGWQTVFHEIGHALGLKHPGNYNAGGGGTAGPYLKTAVDNQQYSIMSYNDTTYTSRANNRSYMLYDVAALQYLYGIKANGSTGASSFNFSNSNIPYLQTIWSITGTDKIDLTGLTHASHLNLNSGTYSSINIRDAFTNNNVGIGYGSKINQVKLTTDNTINDKVILNTAFKSSAYNTIENLTSGDMIGLSKSIFGKLTSSNIQIGSNNTATSRNTKILVNSDTREIYYDSDGSGSRAAVKIASYTSTSAISSSNFSFVA